MPRITVDGVDYAPVGHSDPVVGVGVTTRNRPDVLAKTLEAFRSLSPGVPVVVVDDSGEIPNGIPASKNKCISELMKLGVQHLFLFDDDTRPLSAEWWRPYVESPQPHLQHSWTHFANGKPVERMKVLHTAETVAYGWSMGCMLYTHRDVVNRVGGMREDFSPAMHEHIEWSQRIHNAGFTLFPFQDVPNSDRLIQADDRTQTVKSSIALADRRAQLARNDALLERFAGDSSYVPFGTEDIVLTCLFTGKPDPQRRVKMNPDPTLADQLLASCNAIVVLCDFDTDRPNFLRVPASESPYFQRWISYRQYLLAHPEIRFVWCVDATDVVQLQNPFPMEPGVLYCGWENQIVGCEWMRKHHPASKGWIEQNVDKNLLNAGVVGADRQTMLTFISRLLAYWAADPTDQAGDMAYFNRAAYTLPHVTGPRITTLFKANQPNDFSLWRHK